MHRCPGWIDADRVGRRGAVGGRVANVHRICVRVRLRARAELITVRGVGGGGGRTHADGVRRARVAGRDVAHGDLGLARQGVE